MIRTVELKCPNCGSTNIGYSEKTKARRIDGGRLTKESINKALNEQETLLLYNAEYMCNECHTRWVQPKTKEAVIYSNVKSYNLYNNVIKENAAGSVKPIWLALILGIFYIAFSVIMMGVLGFLLVDKTAHYDNIIDYNAVGLAMFYFAFCLIAGIFMVVIGKKQKHNLNPSWNKNKFLYIWGLVLNILFIVLSYNSFQKGVYFNKGNESLPIMEICMLVASVFMFYGYRKGKPNGSNLNNNNSTNFNANNNNLTNFNVNYNNSSNCNVNYNNSNYNSVTEDNIKNEQPSGFCKEIETCSARSNIYYMHTVFGALFAIGSFMLIFLNGYLNDSGWEGYISSIIVALGFGALFVYDILKYRYYKISIDGNIVIYTNVLNQTQTFDLNELTNLLLYPTGGLILQFPSAKVRIRGDLKNYQKFADVLLKNMKACGVQ